LYISNRPQAPDSAYSSAINLLSTRIRQIPNHNTLLLYSLLSLVLCLSWQVLAMVTPFRSILRCCFLLFTVAQFVMISSNSSLLCFPLVFTARCTRPIVQSAVLRLYVVCPSVCRPNWWTWIRTTQVKKLGN